MKFFISVLLLALLFSFQSGFTLFDRFFLCSDSIKVGLVYSMTGYRGPKEIPSLKAALLAIKEINEKGGIEGKKIIPLIQDSQSNWTTTKANIEHLILNENVKVIFGGWSPASLYTTVDLFEKHQHLLVHPFQYEGIVNSSHVIWVGATLNQQVAPTVAYCLKNIGKRVYLIGSDYLMPHIINMMAKDQIQILEGSVVGEKYIPLNSHSMETFIEDIVQAKPDVILSSIIGKEKSPFFKELRAAGIKPDRTPVFSFSLGEVFLQEMDIEDVAGNYATWNYFQSIDTPENKIFVKNFQDFSHLPNLDNAAEGSYIGVHLWAQAVLEAKTTDPLALSYILASMRFEAPEGPITMDMEGRRAWKYSRIGKILPNGQFEVIWQSRHPIRPLPIQIYRSEAEWQELTDHFYKNFAMENG